MIRNGYEQGRQTFDILFKNGTDDFDYIYEKITFFKSLKSGAKLRITVDVAMDNLNKFLQKFVAKI
jgi:hypothetical protein